MAGAGGKKVALGLQGETQKEAESRSMFDFSMVRVYIYAVIVELSIKAVWLSEDQGREPRYSHDVAEFFSELQLETQKRIKKIYIAACSAYNSTMSTVINQRGRESMQVEMATLEEALAWNATAIKDYKYDLKPDGRTVPCGVMWGGERVYVWGRCCQTSPTAYWISLWSKPAQSARVALWLHQYRPHLSLLSWSTTG